MIRFTQSNWDRFFTKNKKSTIRTHELREGIHNVFSGPRFQPIFLGKVKISKLEKSCAIKDLTEQDAIDDGFDRKGELAGELWKLNKEMTPKTIVFKHWVEVIQVGGER